ncbi:MAG: Rnf-Nqr domain containing protein [Pseudomonadota bacterium]
MNELLVILLGTVLANHYVQDRFLPLRPFAGARAGMASALTVSVITGLVITLSTPAGYLIHDRLLVPLQVEYLRTLSVIVVITLCVRIVDRVARRLRPDLDEALRCHSPLIAINSAVLGVALLALQLADSLTEAMLFAVACAGGFAAMLTIFAAIREHLASVDVPTPFRGLPIAMMTAGIMSLALFGLAGIVQL